MNQILNAAFAAAGAAAWGGLSFSALGLDGPALQRVLERCPHPSAVLVAAFPYYAGDRPGNLSLYARGEDYHLVLVRRLTPICDLLRENYPSYSFFPAADNSPLPERQIAWRAGLGLRGRHGLLILPPYGSYVFLGTILTDAPLSFPAVPPAPGCLDCGACRAACPTGAVDAGPGACLSALTQKKGGLSQAEAARIATHPYVWGCDLCQKACPYNRAPKHTGLPEFSTDLLDQLTPGLLDGLSNRTFQAAYGNRAFAWRGPAVLRRNLALQGGGIKDN